jgi:hypothetical protein
MYAAIGLRLAGYGPPVTRIIPIALPGFYVW